VHTDHLGRLTKGGWFPERRAGRRGSARRRGSQREHLSRVRDGFGGQLAGREARRVADRVARSLILATLAILMTRSDRGLVAGIEDSQFVVQKGHVRVRVNLAALGEGVLP
jgi:hypothetical protein